MHATDLVEINGITRVLLVYTCQQGVYPRGHVLPFRLPVLWLQLCKISNLKRYCGLCILFGLSCLLYRVSHLTWNPPRQNALAAAAWELPGDVSVTTQNIVVAC
jgi:hypothetical protein